MFTVHDAIYVIVNAVNNILKFNHFHITAITSTLLLPTYMVAHVFACWKYSDMKHNIPTAYKKHEKKLCALAATSR